MPRVAKRKKEESSDEESKSSQEESKSSSSESDGPEDRTPVPKGKKKAVAAKSTAKSSAASGSARTDDEEPTWELDRNRFLKVRKFKGNTLVDIREFYEKDGKKLPGKKGISLSANQWKKLVSVIAEVENVL